MVQQQPDLLPQVSVKPSGAETWARRKTTSAMAQSILQGESVPDAAKRIRSVVEMDRRASLHAARTALTGAKNAGRMGSYRRASGMGIELQKQWMATLDSRTRDSHRELDGEEGGIDGRFSNGLSYPGDPTGPASEVWNCRCTMVAALPGHDLLWDRNTSKLETSYEEWKAGRDPKKPRPSGRTLKEFMDTPAVGKAAGRPGMSKTRVRKAIADELRRQGKTGRDFPSMSRAEQQAVLKRACGALNSDASMNSKRMRDHAVAYYNEIRGRDERTEAKRIAAGGNVSEEDALTALRHLFKQKHDLGGSDPEYFTKITKSLSRGRDSVRESHYRTTCCSCHMKSRNTGSWDSEWVSKKRTTRRTRFIITAKQRLTTLTGCNKEVRQWSM